MASEADPQAGAAGPAVDDERAAQHGGQVNGADAGADEATVDDAAEQVELAADERCRRAEDQLRRALADLDNLRKRFQREVVRERSAERARVAALWLPVVDDLERALQHGGADPSSVLDGVRAVYEHALAALDQLGYPRYEDVGQTFDPDRHEATTTIDSDLPRGTVLAVMRPGYGREADILRPASVVVSRGTG